MLTYNNTKDTKHHESKENITRSHIENGHSNMEGVQAPY